MKAGGLALLGLLSLALFIAVAGLVLGLPFADSFDTRLMLSVNHLELVGTIQSVLVAAALYGREYFWAPLVGVMLLLGDRETKLLALQLAVLFAVGIVAGELLKSAAFRARPPSVLAGVTLRVPSDPDSSFPSGHALITSIGGAFSILKFRRRAVALLLSLEAVIVCFARVFVGVHFPTDVVAGAALGVSVAALGLLAEERYGRGALERAAEVLVRVLRAGPLSLGHDA